MARLPFVKMQAVGNDFMVVDAREWPGETAWDAAALFLCDRKFGVGSDGLLVVGPSNVADVRMQMFNPDGTEDMCGNGLRCVIQYARETGLFTGDAGTAECLPGLYPFRVDSEGTITVNMEKPHFAPDAIPIHVNVNPVVNYPLDVEQTTMEISAVSTGSTHVVAFCQSLPEDEGFFLVSPLIEHHRLFPERTSVMYAVVEGDDALRLRIWERGAGETLGCGTGACAAAVLARQTGRINADQIVVHSKGGTLHVSWAGGEADPMFLTGTAHMVYEGTIEYPPLSAKETNRAES